MSKDKLIKVTKYAADIESRLSNSLPKKHKSREASYKAFLNRELDKASKQIEEMKMLGLDKK